MTRADLYVGAEVYHCLLYNWGKGVVLKYRDRDMLGYKTAKKYLVRFEGRDSIVWTTAGELRKTPRVRR